MIYERVNVELGRGFFDTEEAWQQYIKEARKCKQCEELVEALSEAELQIEYLQQKFQETGSGNSVLGRIRTVLAKYRGDR